MSSFAPSSPHSRRMRKMQAQLPPPLLRHPLRHELSALIGRLQHRLTGAARHELHEITEALAAQPPDDGSEHELHGLMERVRGLARELRPGRLVSGVAALGALADVLGRRIHGEYETDEFGLDNELVEAISPITAFLYHHYFRVRTEGIHHVPAEGPTMLVANHAGIILWDGAMLATAIQLEHPQPRLMRAVYLSWFARLPFIAPLLARVGQVQAMTENTRQLLQRGELVGVFPEGMKGAGKLFRERYRLARFGRGGFVRVAIQTGAKLVPVSIVGAEETYPMFYRLGGPSGNFLGMPFLPLTPLFPWLGPLGMLPLPSRFRIRFHAPIDFGKVDPREARDFTLIHRETQRIRSRIQSSVDELRAARGNPYFGP